MSSCVFAVFNLWVGTVAYTAWIRLYLTTWLTVWLAGTRGSKKVGPGQDKSKEAAFYEYNASINCREGKKSLG